MSDHWTDTYSVVVSTTDTLVSVQDVEDRGTVHDGLKYDVVKPHSSI